MSSKYLKIGIEKIHNLEIQRVNMKRCLILSMFLILMIPLAALESEPSAMVGHVKIEAPANSWSMLALPFAVDGEMVSTVFSDGLENPYITGGTNSVLSDQIALVGGSVAWYNSATSLWMGDFAVNVTKPYYSVIRNDHPSADIYICGAVDDSTVVYYDNIPENAWTAIGYREAGEMLVGELGLLEAGFTGGINPVLSDQIVEVGGAVAWYNSATSLWMPETFTIKPGKAYYLVIRDGHSGLASYTYPSNSKVTSKFNLDFINPTRIKNR